jgi:aspartate 1-decarboxylase
MLKVILGSKIHRAIVTDANVDYEGSMAIDEDFLEEAGISPFEKILVGNQTNGHRFETYAIKAPRGSKSIVLNGAVAHLGKTGDRITIMTFALLTPEQLKQHKPTVIVLNDKNEIISRRGV